MDRADEIIRDILRQRAADQAQSGKVPLYARQHEYTPGTPGGKCAACGEYREDSRHQEVSGS